MNARILSFVAACALVGCVASLQACKLEGKSGTVGLACTQSGDCQDDSLGCVPVDNTNPAGARVCLPPPPDWICKEKFYGDGLCDCGCGVVDDDCASSDKSACALPDGDHCTPNGKTIVPNDNKSCQ